MDVLTFIALFDIIDTWEMVLIMLIHEHIKSKNFPYFIHHRRLMLHHGVDIPIECHRRVFMPQYFRQGFDVNTTFDGACCERVTQGMKTTVRNS